MMKIALIIVCAGINVVYGQTDCSILPNGHYGIGCKTYDVCENHQLTTVECPMYMVYNHVKQNCDYEALVGPPCGLYRDCFNMTDGSYTDYELQCTSYYTCHNHVYYGHNLCPDGLVFEKAYGLCVWPVDAYPPCGTNV
ncbi:chitin binding [Mactra antiquata]